MNEFDSSSSILMPTTSDVDSCSGPLELEMELTLEEVARDAHMHSVFLQFLSANDKKGFARLLFLYVPKKKEEEKRSHVVRRGRAY